LDGGPKDTTVYYSPQSCSSELSPQSLSPSHTHPAVIHGSLRSLDRHSNSSQSHAATYTKLLSIRLLDRKTNAITFSASIKTRVSYKFSCKFRLSFITGSIARSATRRFFLIYSDADFEVFRPAGATRCTDCGEIWHLLLRAKFNPNRCNT